MKRMRLHTKLFSAFAALAAGSLCLAQAQTFTNIVLTTFDSPSDSFVNFAHWWGGSVYSFAWDPQNASGGGAGSGCVKVNFDWTPTSPLSGFPQPQFAILDGNGGGGWNASFNGYPATAVMGFYYDLDFDIKMDPASATSAANGTYGTIQAGVAVPGWSQRWLWSTNFPAGDTGWHHVHAYIDPTLPGIDAMGGFCLILPWQQAGSGTSSTNAFYTNASQVTTFYLDNIQYTTNLTKPLNPPTLTLKPVKPLPGLNLNTASSDGGNDRESIATVSPNYSWAGASSPVTYSIKIAKYPGTNYSGFQTHLFLCSGAGGAAPGTEDAPDWNEPNCVFIQIQNNADGTGQARFMWKTNDAGANDMLWGAGTLGILHDTNGVLGTWSFTFANNTNITITTPSGTTTNLFFPDSDAVTANFPQGGTVAYFGVQANAGGNTGQGVVVTNIKVNGGGLATINDNFDTGVLNALTP